LKKDVLYVRSNGMGDASSDKQAIIDAYRQRAFRYDLAVRLFDIFAWLGFNISGWRNQAISELGLKDGDTVVDVGCGTGLNFPRLYQAVGPRGTIIGVDLSDAMLVQARKTAEANQWANVHLVCADATQFRFPSRVDAVLSAYALTLIPDPGRVVSNAAAALAPDGRLVVLDMAWPRYCPLWWRHVLFFLRSYGVTVDVLRRRPWERVQRAMAAHLSNVTRQTFWFGFFYLASGASPNSAALFN
jgi:demethylmenaquinone methyltransferase/2-methoxy-6-polyprenyl-1,4-benzoquinol methylase